MNDFCSLCGEKRVRLATRDGQRGRRIAGDAGMGGDDGLACPPRTARPVREAGYDAPAATEWCMTWILRLVSELGSTLWTWTVWAASV